MGKRSGRVAHDERQKGRRAPRAMQEHGAQRTGRRQQFGFIGWFYLGTTVIIALGAVNAQNNLLFFAFGAAIAGLLLSGVIGGTAILGVRADRVIVDQPAVGSVLRVQYRVRHTGRMLGAFCLTIHETPERAGTSEPTGRRGRAEEVFAAAPVAWVAHVPPGGGVVAEASAAPAKRGMLLLDRFVVQSRFPFGVIRKIVQFSQPAQLVVHPASAPIRRDLFTRLSRSGVTGVQTAALTGGGDEYYGVREYVAGDSMRDIAWRASARSSQLLVRERAAPRPRRVWVVLDVRPEDDEALREQAISIAASVVRLAAERDDLAVGLAAPAQGVIAAPRPARTAVRPLLDLLALLDVGRTVDDRGIGAVHGHAVIGVSAGAFHSDILPQGAMRLSAARPETWQAQAEASS
ncbi:MAG: DUF58 domain-containing protein [Phycisphaeraceae bacterium]|nr:DUF58 domain-containing protein [Phycisphaeraceae bacterium]